MAEITSSRTRLLTLVEIMTMYSDEQNIMSIEEICEKLAEYGYEVSKRNVIADIKVINTTPVKIIQINKPKKGYYLAKSFSQAAINMILEAVYSSPLLSEENCNYIENYLRRNTCLATLDLILDTTEHFRVCLPQRKSCIDSLYNIRVAIRDKKQTEITVARTVIGDSFSQAEMFETVTVNPIKITACNGISAFVFTRAETPDKAEFVNIPRIKSADITDKPSAKFDGDLFSAVNMFTEEKIFCNARDPEWILIKFRQEDAEFIRNCFSSSVYFRKSEEEGYCLAKLMAVVDSRLIGILFTHSDKIEIIKPDNLRDFFNSKINNN
ncbi:MAG: WYL domain-containing protein [Clostridia bacterium]|nr:WYL domain-containing protein [Clostridia bacterium]MBR3819100.1 WYL domain-containing protein [Clostridia bacterium]